MDSLLSFSLFMALLLKSSPQKSAKFPAVLVCSSIVMQQLKNVKILQCATIIYRCTLLHVVAHLRDMQK